MKRGFPCGYETYEPGRLFCVPQKVMHQTRAYKNYNFAYQHHKSSTCPCDIPCACSAERCLFQSQPDDPPPSTPVLPLPKLTVVVTSSAAPPWSAIACARVESPPLSSPDTKRRRWYTFEFRRRCMPLVPPRALPESDEPREGASVLPTPPPRAAGPAP